MPGSTSATIAMGLAIVPAYDTESQVAANAVVVTRVLNADGVFGYSLSVQEGNNLVTNPDPGTYSEVTIAGFGLRDEPTVDHRHPVRQADRRTAPERTEPVLPDEQMLELVDLAKRVERAYCRATPGYYPDCDFVTAANDKEARSTWSSRFWRTASSSTSRSGSSAVASSVRLGKG